MSAMFHPKVLRQIVIDMAFAGNAVHIGCAFSIIELLSCLYSKQLRFNKRDPLDPLRDYLVLSKGHGVMAQYACLYQLGWLQQVEMRHYFQDGTRLKGLSDAHIPGCEVTSGSLGHGLSVGVGLTLAAQRLGTGQRCYCIVGDGEINEGTIWEALMFAAHAKLESLMVIIDTNGFQAMGRTVDVMALGDIQQRFEAFGFDTLTVDGHDIKAIDMAIEHLHTLHNNKPKALVARTVKGKGVSWMEGDNAWHYSRLTPETYAKACLELTEYPL